MFSSGEIYKIIARNSKWHFWKTLYSTAFKENAERWIDDNGYERANKPTLSENVIYLNGKPKIFS